MLAWFGRLLLPPSLLTEERRYRKVVALLFFVLAFVVGSLPDFLWRRGSA